MTILLHPDRYSLTNVIAKKSWIVIHDSESGDDSFTSLLAYLQRPGDRPLANTTRMYGSGYHALTNGLGGYVEVADATCGPYAAPPRNKDAWHICMPGYAKQNREEWMDTKSLAHIEGVAKFIIAKSKLDGIPIVAVPQPNLAHGYCSHWDVTAAWGKTTHTDPGPNFPWDILAATINHLTNPVTPPPVGEIDMPYLIRPHNDAAVFIVEGLAATWAVSAGTIQEWTRVGKLLADPILVDRTFLRLLTLYGPTPNYSFDGGLPGRTFGTDFAAWVQ